MPADQSKKLEKKRRIIESAYQLFREKNIYNTAVDDIVKASGIARGTFYLYFKDKSDLIEQLVFYKSGESMKEMMRQAASRAAEAEDLEGYARVFIDALIDSLIEHREVLTVVNKNLSVVFRAFPAFYDETAEALYRDITGRFLESGYTKEAIDRLSYLVFELISAASYDAITYGKPFGIEELRPLIVSASLAVLRDGLGRADA